ncbi:hypothetical protein QJQ45_029210 [Haematococcus lacustris]|nr:hypothetical protein QJQ45_029210 [Haematococcus lacustris]
MPYGATLIAHVPGTGRQVVLMRKVAHAPYAQLTHCCTSYCGGLPTTDSLLNCTSYRGVVQKAIQDDDGSVCGRDRSRVTFNASAGVDYLVVVEGFLSTSCGVPAINVTSALPNIASIGSCSNPHNISLGLGSASWVPTTTTCNTTDSFPCRQARDYTYRLPAFNATRSITIDTCVAGVDAWDTVLYVFPAQGGACTSCPDIVLFDDQGSVCGQDRSRVTFNASAGVDYLVVVEGYITTSCGVPAINVASALPNIASIGSCNNPHNISLGLGSASWVPTTTTCNTTNSFPCRQARDYTYRLPAFNAMRSITIDTCVAGVDAWDTVLHVFAAQGSACTLCPVSSSLQLALLNCTTDRGVVQKAIQDDDGSVCGQHLSRVTFNASAGVDYLVVVEGFLSTSCGVPAIVVTSTLVQAPPNITSIGSCNNPHNISLGLGSASWVPTTTTCNTTDSFPCRQAGDYTYRLQAFNAMRSITIDTCVAGVDAWDTVLYVFPAQGGACTFCPVSSSLQLACGVPAINVTSALPNIASIGSCNNPHNISLGLGSASWVPNTTICNTTNSFTCRQARDYTYRLQAFNATRSITIDTCVAGVDAWDSVLYCGLPAINVTSAPPNITSIGSCNNPHNISLGLGSASWVPNTTICNTTNSFTCRQARDYTYRLQAFNATRSITIDTCVAGVDAWDSVLYCGLPAINVTSAPPNITSIGSCNNPHNISLGLGSASWVPTTTTCNTTDSSRCYNGRDYTYRLPAFNATRNITVDTCVAGVDAWDTVLYVFPAQGGACTFCPVSSSLQLALLRHVVACLQCGVPAINVTSTLVQAPPNIASIGSCNNPLDISLGSAPWIMGLGSASWIPTTTTCNTTDSFPCRQARDYTYRLPAFNAMRSITIDTCVAGVDAWDTVLYVFPAQGGACTFCPVSSSLQLALCKASYCAMWLLACLQCGVPAISVTSTLVQAPPNITSIGSCNNPHNISLGLGSASWVPTTTTCNTTDSFPCRYGRDYTYRLPAFNATRNITVDTCVAGVDAWDTILFVFPAQGGACTFCPVSSSLQLAVCVPIRLLSFHGWLQSRNLLFDDQGSVCGQDRSRVTFNASAGVDYLVVVEGYLTTSVSALMQHEQRIYCAIWLLPCLQCGVPAIDVTSTLVQAPPNITSIGSCSNPHNISLGLGSASWIPTTTTCNTTNSFPCRQARDYTYRLPAFNATRSITIDTCSCSTPSQIIMGMGSVSRVPTTSTCDTTNSSPCWQARDYTYLLAAYYVMRTITIDTCVAGVDAWDTVLIVFPAQGGACTSCSCGVPAISVTSAPTNTFIGSCFTPHQIIMGLGSASWVPTTTTCDTTDSSPCWQARDYTYRLPAFNAMRSITIDNCVAGVDAWNILLYVFPAQGGACTSCSVSSFLRVAVSWVLKALLIALCGVPAINVTSTLVQAPPNITSGLLGGS